MPNSIDFYKEIFLHVIPVRIAIPWRFNVVVPRSRKGCQLGVVITIMNRRIITTSMIFFEVNLLSKIEAKSAQRCEFDVAVSTF